MWSLIKIVIPKIQAEWEDVAYSMQYDVAAVKAFKKTMMMAKGAVENSLRIGLIHHMGLHQKLGQNLLKGLKMLILLKLKTLKKS